MYYIVIDIETSGLPPRNSAYKKYHDPQNYTMYNNSRIVELAYSTNILQNGEPFVVGNYSSIVKPENFVIENDFIHKISHNNANKWGETIQYVLDSLMNVLTKVDVIVAHNLEFDISIILSELYRLGRLDDAMLVKSKVQFCTMLHGMKWLGEKRWPKLITLYKTLYPTSKIEQSHRAMDDVNMCNACLIKIIP
jgi:DNA polymerase III epsilon subunit-like protein